MNKNCFAFRQNSFYFYNQNILIDKYIHPYYYSFNDIVFKTIS